MIKPEVSRTIEADIGAKNRLMNMVLAAKDRDYNAGVWLRLSEPTQ
jgi:hypothetical protein